MIMHTFPPVAVLAMTTLTKISNHVREGPSQNYKDYHITHRWSHHQVLGREKRGPLTKTGGGGGGHCTLVLW